MNVERNESLGQDEWEENTSVEHAMKVGFHDAIHDIARYGVIALTALTAAAVIFKPKEIKRIARKFL